MKSNRLSFFPWGHFSVVLHNKGPISRERKNLEEMMMEHLEDYINFDFLKIQNYQNVKVTQIGSVIASPEHF